MAKAKKPTKFIVSVREVHIQMVEVEAASEDEAMYRVAKGEGKYLENTEYSHSLDPETWTVEVQP